MKKIYFTLMIIFSATGLLITSCYKQFDPASYAPKFTINGFTSVDQIKPANLVGYWALQGSLIDSVSGASLTNSGTSYVNAFIGKGLGLNASGKTYVSGDPSTGLKAMQSFTISFWANPTFVDIDNNGKVDGAIGLVNIANPNDFWGYLDWFIDNNSTPASAIIGFHFRGGALDTFFSKSGVLNIFGKWSNHTLVYDAATSKITYYLNGSVLIPGTTMPWTGALDFSGIGPLVFGCMQFQTSPSLGTAGSNQPWASWLTGSLDEVRIYNAVLTADEINAMIVLQGKSVK